MRYPRMMVPMSAHLIGEKKDSVGMTGIWGRLFCSKSMSHVPEFTRAVPDKHDYAQLIPNDDPRVKYVIAQNGEAHAPFVNSLNTQTALWGKSKGKTALLVLAGPSAAGIADRIAPYRDNPNFKVFTLNKSAHAVPDADYFFCYEQLCPPDYFAHLDPERTTLLTAPCARAELATKWKGKNAYYAYMGDMRCPEDPRWEHLPLVVSALATCVPALQTIYHMGFSNILVVGSDFAVINPESGEEAPVIGGQFYFDGTRYDKFPAPGKKPGSYYDGVDLALIMGIDNQPCATNQMMHRHMHAFACTMEILDDAGINIKNCAGQGILDYNQGILEVELIKALGPFWHPNYAGHVAALRGESHANDGIKQPEPDSGVVEQPRAGGPVEHTGDEREAASSADCVLA